MAKLRVGIVGGKMYGPFVQALAIQAEVCGLEVVDIPCSTPLNDIGLEPKDTPYIGNQYLHLREKKIDYASLKPDQQQYLENRKTALLEQARKIIEGVDILIMPGHNYNPNIFLPADQYARGDIEDMVFDYALKSKKPLLGVCGGFFRMMEHFGARLEDMPEDLKPHHENPNTLPAMTGKFFSWFRNSDKQYDGTPIREHLEYDVENNPFHARANTLCTHYLDVDPQSYYGQLLAESRADGHYGTTDEIMPYSSHNVMIDENTVDKSKIRISARSEDGHIEAGEVRDHPFMIGTLSHHEHGYDRGIMKTLLKGLIRVAEYQKETGNLMASYNDIMAAQNAQVVSIR